MPRTTFDCETKERPNPLNRERKTRLTRAAYVVTAITLPETNIAPENRPSQKETSIPTIHL